MALTLLADAWLRERAGTLTALTVDHRLRSESTAEAHQVAAWMKTRSIAHHILTPKHTPHSNNTQNAARQWRYDALAEYCSSNGILHCLIAHHAGDNRETMLLHRQRGETTDGDSGMSAVRTYRGVRFLRPMLQLERAELVGFLEAHAATWIEDPSNRNMQFARVRMRQQLSEPTTDHEAIDAAIHAAAFTRTERDDDFAQAAMELVQLQPLGFAQIDLKAWQALDTPLANRLLADCLRTISGSTHRPRLHETEALAQALREDNFRKRTLQHCEISVKGNAIRIAREAAKAAAPVVLSGSGSLRWDGRFTVEYSLPPALSLTLKALGPAGRRQTKAFADLPAATPALWHLDELVHVPHMAGIQASLPEGACVRIGFAPAKPLAAAPFWCLNQVTP